MNLSLEHTYIITKRNLIRKMNSHKVFTYLCRHFAKMLATFIFLTISIIQMFIRENWYVYSWKFMLYCIAMIFRWNCHCCKYLIKALLEYYVCLEFFFQNRLLLHVYYRYCVILIDGSLIRRVHAYGRKQISLFKKRNDDDTFDEHSWGFAFSCKVMSV